MWGLLELKSLIESARLKVKRKEVKAAMGNKQQKKAVRFGWPVDRKIPRNSREWTMFWLSIALTLVISWAFYLSRWPVPVRKVHFIFHDDVNRLMDLKIIVFKAAKSARLPKTAKAASTRKSAKAAPAEDIF